MKNKMLTMALAGMLALGMVACGGDDGGETDTTTDTATDAGVEVTS